MSNALYDKGRQAFLEGGIAILTDNIKAVLINTAGYTVNLATHQYLSDIPAGGRTATLATNMGTKTSTAGVFNAANITFPAVTGVVSQAVVLFKDTGTATTSPLICYIDNATGLPVTPNGGDITVNWDTGANKIFKL
jgi:hypothetical protein